MVEAVINGVVDIRCRYLEPSVARRHDEAARDGLLQDDTIKLGRILHVELHEVVLAYLRGLHLCEARDSKKEYERNGDE